MGGVVLVLKDDEVFSVESLCVDYKEEKGNKTEEVTKRVKRITKVLKGE